MQIHELNTFSGTPGASDYLATDNGVDTSKISIKDITDPLNARIDNIIASPAPSEQEIIDARLGANGVTYTSLGDAIRGQCSDLQAYMSAADVYAENLSNERILISADFVRGAWAGNGNFDPTPKYRIATRNKISFNRSVTYSVEAGFRFRAIKYDKATGTVSGASSWVTTTYTFTDEFLYGVNIARITANEDVSEIANVAEFISKVYWNREGIDLLIPGSGSSEYNNLLANVDINARTNIIASYGWTDTPAGETSGLFTNHHFTAAFDLQTFVSHTSGAEYNRIVRRTTREIYRDWEALDCVTGIGTEASTYSNLLANVDINARGNIVASYGWLDTPAGNNGGMFANYHYNNSFDLQTFITHSSGIEYNRIVRRSNRTVYRDWKSADSDGVKALKALGLGDSIARGGRNGGKGFVGDIGLPFINMGVGGATLSNIHSTYTDSIHKFPDADNIPNQLTSYYNASDADIQTAFGIAKFVPDVIIAEGGINDYFKNGALGNIPTVPVSSDAEANALDRSTLMGGLQYLFYNMVKLYHKAQRFFVITHKTYRTAYDRYCPVVANTAGYTQKEMHDAIVQCCEVYGVKVIDIYNESMLDTKFSEYRAQTESWHDANADDYCDYDGVHPLAYGYQQAYVPLVREALGIGTEK